MVSLISVERYNEVDSIHSGAVQFDYNTEHHSIRTMRKEDKLKCYIMLSLKRIN